MPQSDAITARGGGEGGKEGRRMERWVQRKNVEEEDEVGGMAEGGRAVKKDTRKRERRNGENFDRRE